MCPQSKIGIPALTQCKINALDTIFLGLVSEDKVNVTVRKKGTILRPKVYPHTKFGIPTSNYITDGLWTWFRFRLADAQIVSCVSGLHVEHHHLLLHESAAPLDVNVKANQICMTVFPYDAVGCAYLIGLQVAHEAAE